METKKQKKKTHSIQQRAKQETHLKQKQLFKMLKYEKSTLLPKILSKEKKVVQDLSIM